MSTHSFSGAGGVPKDVIQGEPGGQPRIAVVTARWNHDVTYKLEEGARFLSRRKRY
jgi:6,7-dimethyl-8-ribityllumazine synthase